MGGLCRSKPPSGWFARSQWVAYADFFSFILFASGWLARSQWVALADFISFIFLPVGGLRVASGWLCLVFVSGCLIFLMGVLFSLVWHLFPRSRPLGLDSAWLVASHTQGLCVVWVGSN